MKILLSILVLVLFVSCNEKEPRKPAPRADVSFCTDACMGHVFGDFHNVGQSWGTGSSSMNGLSQGEIFFVVKDYCAEFYSDKTCCRYSYGNHVKPEMNHGGSFGACKKGE